MTEKDFLSIDCTNLSNFLYPLKNLLKNQYNVQIKTENCLLKIFGNKESINQCNKIINYYLNVDSQYLLAINNFSKDSLKLNELILLFQVKCKCLLLLDDNTLHLLGNFANVNLLYHYFLKYDRLVEKENVDINFSEEENKKLRDICIECGFQLPKYASLKSRMFINNILMNRARLFNQIIIDNLSSNLESVSVEDGKSKNNHNLSNVNDVPLPYQVIIESENYETFEDNCKSKNISLANDIISKYRTIIIDGNNVAFGHGGDKFSCMGIKLAIDYFVNRGHKKIYALLPRHRKAAGKVLFDQLERDDRLKYTPSRKLNNVRETPYDDRFILDAAIATGGVVISNDQYRDLMGEEKYREIISNRLIPYTFIEDHIIIPDDPRGQNGPSLGDMLANPSRSSHRRSPRKNSYSKRVVYHTPQKSMTKTPQNMSYTKRSQSQPREGNGHYYCVSNQPRESIQSDTNMTRREDHFQRSVTNSSLRH